MLSLSPAERLQVLQENVRAILRLRREQTKLPFDTSDGLVSESRRHEKGIPLEKIKADLIKRGRLRE
jgi:hypothetical protein